VRAAAWSLIVCLAVAALAVFLAGIELRVAGVAISHRTELSLYQIAGDRELVRRAVVEYHRHASRGTGKAVLAALVPRTRGAIRDAADDDHSALDTLDEISERDADHAGIALRTAVWGFLALCALAAVLVFPDLVAGELRRRRVVLALIVALLLAIVGVAFHLGLREAVWQANDEVGHTVVGLGAGAWALAIGSVGAFASAVVVVIAGRSRSARS